MATIIIPNFVTPKVVNGLNSYQYTVNTTNMHVARIEVDHNNSSTMTVSIVQAGSVGSTLATVTLPGQPEGAPQSTTILQATANCTSGDTITFTISSSNAIDNQLNTVKARLNVHVGSSN